MPIGETESWATVLFIARLGLNNHWDRATDKTWRGCPQCEGRNNCRQLDWEINIMVDVWARLDASI